MEGLLDQAGRPVWALRGLVGYLARAAAHLRPDAVLVGFDCPTTPRGAPTTPRTRRTGRTSRRTSAEQIAGAPGLLSAAGVCTVVPPAYEADDVLASSAAHARRHGWRSVLMTSDRDAFALIDDTTSVLRVRNGGFDEAVLVDPEGLLALCGVTPAQYRDYRGPARRPLGQPARGPPASARPPPPGCWPPSTPSTPPGRPSTPATPQSVRDVVGAQATDELGRPETREIVERNRRLMRMRADLPMPELHAARLPLRLGAMRRRPVRPRHQLRAVAVGPDRRQPAGGEHRADARAAALAAAGRADQPPGSHPGPALPVLITRRRIAESVVRRVSAARGSLVASRHADGFQDLDRAASGR